MQILTSSLSSSVLFSSPELKGSHEYKNNNSKYKKCVLKTERPQGPAQHTNTEREFTHRAFLGVNNTRYHEAGTAGRSCPCVSKCRCSLCRILCFFSLHFPSHFPKPGTSRKAPEGLVVSFWHCLLPSALQPLPLLPCASPADAPAAGSQGAVGFTSVLLAHLLHSQRGPGASPDPSSLEVSGSGERGPETL